MKKQDNIILFEYAHREGDYVVIDADGMERIRNMLWIARRRRKKNLDKEEILAGGWNEQLLFGDKVMSELFQSAKEIRIKVDWDKWDPIEKRINAELRRMNK
jgi:hypothetical protein